jgi:hypothetical protein
MTRVYLSGGMEYAENEGRDWRISLQEWLEHTMHCEVFNPNVESEHFFGREYPGLDFRALKAVDLPRYQQIVRRLVELDCEEIAERSELVICYWDEGAARGAGTKGELTIAKFFGKPVYVVTIMPAEQIPGWVLGCTTALFNSFAELKGFLQKQTSA